MKVLSSLFMLIVLILSETSFSNNLRQYSRADIDTGKRARAAVKEAIRTNSDVRDKTLTTESSVWQTQQPGHIKLDTYRLRLGELYTETVEGHRFDIIFTEAIYDEDSAWGSILVRGRICVTGAGNRESYQHLTFLRHTVVNPEMPPSSECPGDSIGADFHTGISITDHDFNIAENLIHIDIEYIAGRLFGYDDPLRHTITTNLSELIGNTNFHRLERLIRSKPPLFSVRVYDRPGQYYGHISWNVQSFERVDVSLKDEAKVCAEETGTAACTEDRFMSVAEQNRIDPQNPIMIERSFREDYNPIKVISQYFDMAPYVRLHYGSNCSRSFTLHYRSTYGHRASGEFSVNVACPGN